MKRGCPVLRPRLLYNRHMLKQQLSVWRYFDVWLLGAVVLLSAYGILMIRSAITGAPEFEGFDLRQLNFMFLGLVLLLAVAAIDYRILTSAHWYIYLGLIGSLLLVAAAGTINNDARRWIQITSGFQFQPSELGRIIFAITFGQFLAQRNHLTGRFSNTILALLYLVVPVGLIFIQPDLGMSVLYIFIWFIMMVTAGLPLIHFLILATTGLTGAGIALPFLAQYQRDRLLAFIDPNAVPDQKFNVDQALISIGSGGPFGKGYGQGTQSQLGFLRVQHTDFIFAMLTEEMGAFFGALVVLGLMTFILLRILRVAQITPDPAGRFICVSVAAFLFFQTAVSVGMNMRLLPVTGLTLPFVSYGGSSLVTLYIAVGVVQSVLMRHRKQEFG